LLKTHENVICKGLFYVLLSTMHIAKKGWEGVVKDW